jgi:hypothetical protein
MGTSGGAVGALPSILVTSRVTSTRWLSDVRNQNEAYLAEIDRVVPVAPRDQCFHYLPVTAPHRDVVILAPLLTLAKYLDINRAPRHTEG